LSIVREIMLRHGGDVVLHAVEPHGLAVVMELPVVGAAGAGRVS
jgi:signal transduction histidine kinase